MSCRRKIKPAELTRAIISPVDAKTRAKNPHG